MFGLLVKALVAYYLAKRVHLFLKARRDYGHLPGIVVALEPLSVLGASLPTTWWNLGLKFTFIDRHSLYNKTAHKTFYVNPLLVGSPLVYTTSIQAFRQVLAVGSDFHKPLRSYIHFQFLGTNVVASEEDTWKRHRRITAPAFNQSAYENVWETTASVYAEVVDKEGWRGENEVRVRAVNKITHKLALFVIAICGFGIRMAWNESPRDAQGRMSIPEMVFEVASSILIRSRVPKWAYLLGTEKLKAVDEAYSTFVAFMCERIAERKDELRKLRAAAGGGGSSDLGDVVRDVFGRLINAQLDEGSKLALSDEEIIGNCFIMIFAGHETTANTLSGAIALLGLYPEIQERVHQSIVEVLGDREPTFDDFDKLENVLACFYEALRLYPAAYLMFRESVVDTTLAIPRQDNPNIIEKVPLRKGTEVIMDFIGMGYDPQVFPDPEEFKPSRFSKSATASPKPSSSNEVSANAAMTAMDGFVNFSVGPRTCLGHKFAKVEGVAFLTLLLREWRVEVELRDGETPAMWRERVLDPKMEVTLAFADVPVKLVRREVLRS